MGKWATYQKRGSALHLGTLGAPNSADWSVGGATTSTFNANRLINLPDPATHWTVRYRRTADPVGTPWAQSGYTGATPITPPGLVGASQYEVQAAWAINPNNISDWSASKFVTTL